MSRLLSSGPTVWFALLLAAPLALPLGCDDVPVDSENEAFPKANHSLLPPDTSEGEWRTSVGRVPQPTDPQPIAFNHSIHAGAEADGGMGMSCEYCHSNARESKHAGVPTTQVCAGCHTWVPKDGRPPLEELSRYLPGGDLEGEPIRWVKVHDLPDFVHFDHSRHIAGGLECTECHADMAKETVAIRDPEMSMEMGWCLQCHSSHHSVETNYGVRAEVRRSELKDCTTCHK